MCSKEAFVCGEQEVGYCDICHKEKALGRIYVEFPNVKCECCSSGGKPQHFHIIHKCTDCEV